MTSYPNPDQLMSCGLCFARGLVGFDFPSLYPQRIVPCLSVSWRSGEGSGVVAMSSPWDRAGRQVEAGRRAGNASRGKPSRAA